MKKDFKPETFEGEEGYYEEAGHGMYVTVHNIRVDDWGVKATVKAKHEPYPFGKEWEISACWDVFSQIGKQWSSGPMVGWTIEFIKTTDPHCFLCWREEKKEVKAKYKVKGWAVRFGVPLTTYFCEGHYVSEKIVPGEASVYRPKIMPYNRLPMEVEVLEDGD